MLANVCLRPKSDEESFRVADEIDNLEVDYDLDLVQGLIIFKNFEDWGKYINSSPEIKSRFGDMDILWEGGTVTTSHLFYPSLKNPNQIISTKGNCKFNVLTGKLELGNGEEIGWWQLKEFFYRKNFLYLEKPKSILFSSLFATLINFGLIREKFPTTTATDSPFNGFIETFYNLKCLVRMPYEIWSRARLELEYYGLAIERKNLLEKTIDVWLARPDYEEIKNYPNVKILINLNNPKEYIEWRHSKDGHIYVWFKEFPEYLLYNEWVSGHDNFYNRWGKCQIYKIPEHILETWNSLKNQQLTDFSKVHGFICSYSLIPLIIYDTTRYINQFLGIKEYENTAVWEIVSKFKDIYGANLGYIKSPFP